MEMGFSLSMDCGEVRIVFFYDYKNVQCLTLALIVRETGIMFTKKTHNLSTSNVINELNLLRKINERQNKMCCQAIAEVFENYGGDSSFFQYLVRRTE